MKQVICAWCLVWLIFSIANAKVENQTRYKHIQLHISNMTYATCPLIVKQILENQKGIIAVHDSEQVNKMKVIFDPRKIGLVEIIQSLLEEGYIARLTKT